MPTDPLPFITDFQIEGIGRTQLAPYTLSGSQRFTYTIHNPDSVDGNLTLRQGTDVLVQNIARNTSATSATVNTVMLRMSERVTFSLSGTATTAAGGAPFSVSYTITAIEQTGFDFQWRGGDMGAYTTIADQQNGENIDFAPVLPTGEDTLFYRVPSTRRITYIGFGFSGLYSPDETNLWTLAVAGGFATYQRSGYIPGTFNCRVIVNNV